MGASSSGLLDEAKVSHIRGLTESTLQGFSVFYQQQYSAAHITHLHQEVEPKKEGRGLLMTQRPCHTPKDVLYQGSVQVSCWEELGRRGKERHVVLRGDYSLEIHDSMETFSHGAVAKLVLQPAGGAVLTTEEESRLLLEQTCPGLLNGVKGDSSSVVSSPGVFPVFLHLPYTGHTCFLFTQEEQRHHFLSALKTCMRHQNLDPWRDPPYEGQAFIRALRLYQQDRGHYEFWEMLLGPEEKVLASQVMKQVLPWLQSQLQSRVKGKKTERMRQWMATVQATYSLVLEQVTDGLEALKGPCRQTASANQAVIRSNLDQITVCHRFLEDKLRASICRPAQKLCGESVAPCLSSILEAVAECVSAGMQDMQCTLHIQMDTAFTHTHGDMEGLEKALSSLRFTSLDHCYRLVENLTEKLQGLKQRFRFSGAERLVHSVQLEMEQLLDSAVYTAELILQAARRQPSHISTNMERAKHRVLKQLDHDSRLVQKRLYQETLLQITLPAFTREMDSTWKPELQQFEQYIFSDYSSFILVQNVYDDILRDILNKETERVVQEAASLQGSHLLLDCSDLAISQYSLLGQMPPCSAHDSPAVHTQASSSMVPDEHGESASLLDGGAPSGMVDFCPQSDPKPDPNPESNPTSSELSAALQAPIITVTHDESAPTDTCEASNSEAANLHVCGSTDPPTLPECAGSDLVSPNSSVTPPLSVPPYPTAPSESTIQGDPSADLITSDVPPQVTSHLNCFFPLAPPPCADAPITTSLTSLCQAVCCNSTVPPTGPTMLQQASDRAVYLRGGWTEDMKVERVKEERQAAEEMKEEEEKIGKREGNENNIKVERVKEEGEATEKNKEEKMGEVGEEEREAGIEEEEKRERMQREHLGLAQSGSYHNCRSSEAAMETQSTERGEERGEHEEEDGKLEGKKEGKVAEEERGTQEEEGLQSPQPMACQPQNESAMPLDSVVVIRGLVTEVIEVETLVSPAP
ncbi:protein Niban-like [Myripristis murdjan]|uniref:Protein Niban-like n=1 Tax=Myripristis murdjan TaxID=586833 RepID=A0A668AM63_9TELE|nr:protein Niban-like [Myripristis murdjan]XP_029930739.1 protein Niban-like [Myripristis murdjan]